MFNEAQISLAGYVATEPATKGVKDGVTKVSMRVAWTPRWQDRGSGDWVDGVTSYATVYCWRKLADNAAICLRKGDPIVVKGRLTVRSYEKDGVRRETVEIDATALGHDLTHGVATFRRVRPSTGMSAAERAELEVQGITAAGSAGGPPADPADHADRAEPIYRVDPEVTESVDALAAPERDEPFFDDDAVARLNDAELAGNDPAGHGADPAGPPAAGAQPAEPAHAGRRGKARQQAVPV